MKYSTLFVIVALISCRPMKSESNTESSWNENKVNTSGDRLASDTMNLLMEALQAEGNTDASTDTTFFPPFNESDTCEHAVRIIDELSRAIKNDMAVVNSQALINALKENAKNVKSRCYFPRNTSELNLLYRFTDRMMIASKDSTQPIKIIISLDQYLSDVTEYAEHLHSVIAQVALNNTEGFVRELSALDKKDRLIILENLEYSPNMKAIETLRKNLRNISSKELELTVAEAQAAINAIFEK